MNFNNPDDVESSSGVSGSSDGSESDGEEDVDGSEEDDSGTAMSLDAGEDTERSLAASDSSTSSSDRLEAALKQAAAAAGTRGIEYDEHGDTSMQIDEDALEYDLTHQSASRPRPPDSEQSTLSVMSVSHFKRKRARV